MHWYSYAKGRLINKIFVVINHVFLANLISYIVVHTRTRS